MRKAIASILSLTLSGCAAQRAPVAAAAHPQGTWASVAALPPRAPVRITVRYEIDGSLDAVTDATLTIRVPPEMHRLTVDRSLVRRVAVLTPKRMPFRWLGRPLGFGALGGLVGILVGAVMTDAEVAGKSFSVFAAGTVLWFCHFSYHRDDHDWRIVYARLASDLGG